MKYLVSWGENYVKKSQIFDSEIAAHSFASSPLHAYEITEICEHPALDIFITDGTITEIKHLDQDKITFAPRATGEFIAVCNKCGAKIPIRGIF